MQLIDDSCDNNKSLLQTVKKSTNVLFIGCTKGHLFCASSLTLSLRVRALSSEASIIFDKPASFSMFLTWLRNVFKVPSNSLLKSFHINFQVR
jgi:hypothetical protein